MARPTIYTQELADKICSELAEGKSLRTVCLADEIPDKSTIFNWLRTNKEFLDQYTRAKIEASDALADEIQDIADDGSNDWMEINMGHGQTKIICYREHVERSKLRIESRKWIMAKMKPKKYGDKLDLTSDGKQLPTPILAYALPNNDSNQENSGHEETDSGCAGRDISVKDSVNNPVPDSSSPVGQETNPDINRVGELSTP